MLRKPKESTEDPVVLACYQDSYWWLIANQPDMAEGLEHNMDNGSTPYEEYRKVLTLTSRLELAKRVQLAAMYLESLRRP